VAADLGQLPPPPHPANKVSGIISQFGRDNYDIMLGDCLWHVYRLIGKLTGYTCTFTKTPG
jgi:hypothetical protein